MITAIGTLLAALVALASFLVSQQFFADPLSNDDPDGPPATDAAGKKLDEQVMWGPARLLLTRELDFDSPNGPNRDPGTLDTDTYLWLEETISSPSGMVEWTEQKKPGQNDCAALLASHGVGDRFAFDAGDRFCIKTSSGRVAMLLVLPKTPTGWEMEGTVWKQRLTVE